MIVIEGYKHKGISDFMCNTEQIFAEHGDEIIKITNLDEATLTFTMTFNVEKFYRLSGVYDWAYDNCPNHRVRHLIKYGKTKRVRIKNFRRALHMIGMILEG